jgi:hypothetical protein
MPDAICRIAWPYSRSFAPGKTHSDVVQWLKRDLPDCVPILVGAWHLEERVLTRGERLESIDSGAIPPSA